MASKMKCMWPKCKIEVECRMDVHAEEGNHDCCETLCENHEELLYFLRDQLERLLQRTFAKKPGRFEPGGSEGGPKGRH